MNLPTDVPTRAQVERLLAAREPASVSIYLPTDPASRGEAERIALKNLTAEATGQLGRKEAAAIDDELSDLGGDDEFWRYQARSLAVFVTPTSLMTFRLANRLVAMVEVSDRFHLKPLLRAVTFPHTALVLALSQNRARLIEIAADLDPAEIGVPDLPEPVVGAHGKLSTGLRRYARRVDQALRPIVNGLDLPLILAAAEPMDAAYRSVNSYPHLLATGIPGNPETTSGADLAQRARELLDELYATELRELHETYAVRASQRRAASDVADVARAATYGLVDTVLVDIDGSVPGGVDESGAIALDTSDDAINYGVVDEIARRVWLNGGRVLAVRREDIPGNGPVAAILRYAP